MLRPGSIAANHKMRGRKTCSSEMRPRIMFSVSYGKYSVSSSTVSSKKVRQSSIAGSHSSSSSKSMMIVGRSKSSSPSYITSPVSGSKITTSPSPVSMLIYFSRGANSLLVISSVIANSDYL